MEGKSIFEMYKQKDYAGVIAAADSGIVQFDGDPLKEK